MFRDLRLLHETLIESVKKNPNKIAVQYKQKGYTYQKLLNDANKTAAWLIENNLKKGDRVAIFMSNTWSCVVSIYATLIAGGIFFLINNQTKKDKFVYILNDSHATFLLTESILSKIFSSIISLTPSIKGILYTGANLKNKIEFKNINQLEHVLSENNKVFKPHYIIANDLAALIYTSGSTGEPKGVMMRHSNMVFTTGSLVEYLRLDENEKIICAIPLSFDYGLYQLLMSVRIGATLILEHSFVYPTQIINSIIENKVTVVPFVPTMYATMLAMHIKKNIELPDVKKITNTAAALPEEYIPQLKEIFPNALIFKMYGLTECKRVSYLEPELLDEKIKSVGKAIPGTEMFLLSPDDKEVLPGEIGILHVRGPHIMAGYWNKPDMSAKMLKDWKIPEEKILCAQDWFIMDEEGFFYFKGRSDDIIKTRGEKVSPVEVENVLYGIENVLEAAVIGVPDDLFGSAVKAFIVLEQGKEMTKREIVQMCSTKLENFMVPKYVEFVSSLAKTNTGKISKKGLK